MNIPRVKICGITRPDDGRHAARAGADAIGLVFYPPSPRYVSPRRAADIVAALPPFVTTVGLFVDAPPEQIAALLEQVPLDMLQFHGDESPEYCAAFQRPWIKALRMRDGVDPRAEADRYGAAGARGLLVDSYVPGVPGGTGERFDWDRLPADPSLPLVLAGGL
ncbi:MAG TPA: N-(5'-phosphoribosyl)anthranilate isomerase, partial [Alcanivorax sp.]|nr:N-(5'-phosphoribosyl)anthranilate isomerase [Alcanivorax sp.]